MAAKAGRKLRVKYDSGAGAAVIAGARTDGLTINNEMIDITDKDDAGIRTLLDDIGVQSLSMSCEGVLLNDTLAGLARGAGEGSALHDMEFEDDGVGTYAGSFFITSFEYSGAEGTDPATFSCQFESSGAVTFTAA